MDAELHDGLFRGAVGLLFLDGVEDAGQLIAEEHGHDSGGRLVRAEAVVVAGRGHGQTEQILIVVDGLNYRAQKQQELGVFMRRFAGGQQVYARVGCDGPVVVLAAAVDAVKGLFVQQTDQSG